MFFKKIECSGSVPTPRAAHSANIIDDKLYIFAGWNGFNAFNDIYYLNLITNIWTNIFIEDGNIPTIRNNHKTTTFEKKIFLLGGHDGKNWVDDMYSFNSITNLWKKIKIQGYKPSARTCHSLNTIKKKLYLYGGFDGLKSFSDIEIFDLKTYEWVKEEVFGIKPKAREAHCMVSNKENLILFGGHDGENYLNDMNEFNTNTKTWTEIKYKNNINGLRSLSGNLINNVIYFFGGYDENLKSNELIFFNLKEKKWSLPNNKSKNYWNFMNGRQRFSTNKWKKDKIVIFGGFDGKTLINDVYLLDITNFEKNLINKKLKKDHKENFKKKLYLEKLGCDITIITKDGNIKAHKFLLITYWKKLEMEYKSKFQKNKEIVSIDLSKYSIKIVQIVLDYIYLGKIDIQDLSFDYLFEIIILSEEFIIDNLNLLAIKNLQNKITIENVNEVLLKSYKFNIVNLKEFCLDYVIDNYIKIVKQKNFKDLIDNKELIYEISIRLSFYLESNFE